MPHLINRAAVKQYIRDKRPGVRVSREYLDAWDADLKRQIAKQLHMNGSKKTLRDDVFLNFNGDKA